MSILKSLVSYTLLASAISAHPHDKRQSSVPIGQVIHSCTQAGAVAVTFDDGPHIYTEHVLDLLSAGGHHATFFLNGQNYGSVYDYKTTLERMIRDGHQIGSHTWSHQDLGKLDAAGVTSQMTQLEDALITMLGYFPTYMRPPFLSTSDTALAVLKQLEYHVIEIDIDTQDWQNLTPDLISNSVTNFKSGIDSGGTISLSHDPLNNTANALVQAMIDYLDSKGLKSVPVGQCLGDASSNWYRSSRTTPSSTISASVSATATDCAVTTVPTGTIDPNGSCGGDSGFVCGPGDCCSQYGWCGTTVDHCLTGCQPLFGSCTYANCNNNSSSSSSSSSVSSAASGPSASTVSSVGGSTKVSASPSSTNPTSAPISSSKAPSATSSKAPTASATPALPVSLLGQCGQSFGKTYTCNGSVFGKCCSKSGLCGSTSLHCGSGCQSAYGTCTAGGSGSGNSCQGKSGLAKMLCELFNKK